MKRFTNNPIKKLRAQGRALASRPDKNSVDSGSAEVRKLIGQQTGIKPNRVWTDDRKYFLPQKKTVESLLWWDGTDKYQYGREGRDCDVFANILLGRVEEACMLNDCKRGMAFGTAYGDFIFGGKQTGPHAVNICVTADRAVWLIEPQSDQWYRPHQDNTYQMIHL